MHTAHSVARVRALARLSCHCQVARRRATPRRGVEVVAHLVCLHLCGVTVGTPTQCAALGAARPPPCELRAASELARHGSRTVARGETASWALACRCQRLRGQYGRCNDGYVGQHVALSRRPCPPPDVNEAPRASLYRCRAGLAHTPRQTWCMSDCSGLRADSRFEQRAVPCRTMRTTWHKRAEGEATGIGSDTRARNR